MDQQTDSCALDRIAHMLMCPDCSGGLEVEPGRIHCVGCGREYPVRDGVPLLARPGVSDTWSGSDDSDDSSSAYQQEYRAVDAAAEYNAAYDQKFFKRMSTAREYALLRRLLGTQEHCDILLELPCGGGRLSPQIAPFADLIVEADIAEGQVFYGKHNSSLKDRQIWMTASAFHIPFRDNTFDGTVCCRLCHHLPTASERERLVTELLRVSKRFVLMTFFDHNSIKNILRRARRPFDHKPPKMTMTIARVRELARQGGAELVAHPALSITSSGHRYALMVKNPQ